MYQREKTTLYPKRIDNGKSFQDWKICYLVLEMRKTGKMTANSKTVKDNCEEIMVYNMDIN
jgi:hypothetical protein